MFKKCLPLLGALILAGPASAVTVNMSDFTFGTPADVEMDGTNGSPTYHGQAGQFQGTQSDDNTAALRFSLDADATATSFVAWCAQLDQTFFFGTPYDYTLVSGVTHFGALKTTALSRLFTVSQGFVVDKFTSAALQAGIWEIIYEQDPTFSLTAGKFKGVPALADGQPAFDKVDFWLQHLTDYAALARIDVLENGAAQDFLVATIPEPETWMMFGLGLGVVGFLRRRRQR